MRVKNADLAAVIGKQARIARQALGYTQAEVARDVDLVGEVYGRVERGGMIPSVPALVRIATALRVSPATLLGFAAPGTVRPHRRRGIQRLIGLLERADDDTIRAVLTVARVVLHTREKAAQRTKGARAGRR